jgi:hypothetical protein
MGTKLEHFKKSQENLEFHQNKCHPEDVPDMRRQCAKATDQWAQGVAGRPANFYVGSDKNFVDTCLHEKGKAKAVKKVDGGQTHWPASHMAWPPGLHLVCYRLGQVSGALPWPYKYPPPYGGNEKADTTFWRFHLQSSHS